jgi:hypothetical protein
VIGYLKDYVNELKSNYVEAVKSHYRVDKQLNEEKQTLAELESALRVAQQNYNYQAARVESLQAAHDAHLAATEQYE